MQFPEISWGAQCIYGIQRTKQDEISGQFETIKLSFICSEHKVALQCMQGLICGLQEKPMTTEGEVLNGVLYFSRKPRKLEPELEPEPG